MADLVISSVVLKEDGVRVSTVEFGEAGSPGDPVFLSSTTGKYMLADANVDESTAGVVGLLLTDVAADGDFGVVLLTGSIDLGAALTTGTVYVLSAGGGIAPIADLVTDDWLTIIGYAQDSDVLVLEISAKGVQVA